MLKRLGARPGENCDNDSFSLPEHVSLNLTPQQSADRIAEHFSAVSREYEQFDINCLPSHIQEHINSHVEFSQLPKIDSREVW